MLSSFLRSKRVSVFFFCLGVSLSVLLLCTKSSFLYAINDWSDANIFLSMGKGMAEGQVLYRDLYDHKGPLLYALHAVCSLISADSFLGVFLMQVLFGAVFLMLAYQTAFTFGIKKEALFLIPLLAVCVYSSYSYLAGDSAEELCLPFLLFALYDGVRYTNKNAPSMSVARLLAHGFVLGCVCFIKFTLVGLSATLCVFLVCVPLFGKHYRQALRSFVWLCAGFALSTLPWLVYFGLHGALMDWWQVYFYDNLFLYNSTGTYTSHFDRLLTIARAVLSWIFRNPLYAIPTVVGLLRLTFGKAMNGCHRAFALCSFAFLAFPIFMDGEPYPYYCLTLAVYAPVGLCCFLAWMKRLPLPTCKRTVPLIALWMLCVGSCFFLCSNVALSMGVAKEETMQYQFADIILQSEDPTLLNYGFMDAGFYTATGLTPSVKYFHQTNVPLDEMKSEQIRYIEEGICEFVITRGNEPETIHQHYNLIATASSPSDFWYDTVYLYQKKT